MTLYTGCAQNYCCQWCPKTDKDIEANIERNITTLINKKSQLAGGKSAGCY